MKKLSSLLGIVSLLLAAGCASNVKQIGSVGDVQFYRVRANSFSGPNIASLVTKNSSGDVKIEQTYAGPGLGAATISAVGHVGAAAVLGTSFPKNVGDNINATGGVSNGGNSSSHSNSSSTGGNSTSTSTSTSTAGSDSTAAGGKSHPDSPGNGGTPGNGGQNPNKP